MSSSQRAKIIVIQGYPGSGKTTLAKRLAEDTPELPVLRKDALKEWMHDEFGGFRLSDEILGRIAAETLHTAARQIAETGHNLLIESSFYSDFTRPVLTEIKNRNQADILEIYMDVDPQIAHDRLQKRFTDGQRHPVHRKDASSQQEFDERWTARYEIIGVGMLERYNAQNFTDSEYERIKDKVIKFLKG